MPFVPRVPDFSGTFAPTTATKLLGFYAALANRASAPCDILLLADSIGEGVGVNSGTLGNRWINQFLTAMRQAYPVANVAGGFGYKPAWNGAGVSAPTTSGTVTQASNGMGHRSLILGAGATLTYTETGTSFKVLMKRTGTDAITVAVDGGTATAVTAGPSGEFVYSSGALSRASHTIVITQTAGSPEIEGVMLFDGDETAGLRLWDSSKAGGQASDFTTAAGGSQAWLTAAASAAFTPSLVVVAFGTNDALHVSAATFKANVSSLISVLRGRWANVPILLLGAYQPPSRQSGLVEPWASYGTALRQLAATDPATGYLDLMNRIGSVATDTYGLLNDTTHPNNKGHLLYAQTVLDFVRPGMRDIDTQRSSTMNADTLTLDTLAGVTPNAPARGGLLYSDSLNFAVLARLGSGDTINQLGRTVNISSNQNPVRLGWRYNRVTTGTGTITLTLPSAANLGQRFTFKKVDNGTGTVVVTGGTPGGNQQTIEGANTKTLSGQWSYITVISTGNGGAGVGWEIEGQGGTVS